MPAWVWFSGALLLSLAELLGGEFVLLMLGAGALVSAAVAIFAQDLLWLQLIVFALTSVGLVIGARPPLLRRFTGTARIRTGIDPVIGPKATVVSTGEDSGGQARIGGEVGSAEGGVSIGRLGGWAAAIPAIRAS